MAVVRAILEALKGIKKDLEDLKSLQDPSVLEKARKYDEVKKHLSLLNFPISKVYRKIDDLGSEEIVVEYASQKRKIRILDSGDAEFDPFIEAMNFLNLISLEDMMKIRDAIEPHDE